jgi:hypothetical protein
MDHYWAQKSQLSIDGLPGMKRGYEFAQRNGIKPVRKMVGKGATTARWEATGISYWEAVRLFLVLLLGVVTGGCMVVGVMTP